MKSLQIIVSGKVQGVFFRANTQQKAIELGVNGYVRNQDDGSVFIEAVGNENQLQQLTAWCTKGPGKARVTSVKTQVAESQHYSSFEIRK